MPALRFRGYTLIELLTALAVLLILAALILPVIGQTRRKAWQTTCISNQRQTGSALSLYVQDFDETYPNSRFDPPGSSKSGSLETRSWRSVLAPYLHNRQVMVCPANPDNRLPANDPNFTISYAANMTFNPRDYPIVPPSDSTGSGIFGKALSPGVKSVSVVRPAECIAVVETVHLPDSAFVVDFAADYAIQDANGHTAVVYKDCLFTGHSGLSDFLFCDGHVKALKPTATYHGNLTNFWYRDATSLGEEARTTLAGAETQ